MILVCEPTAFYRILLGHHDAIGAGKSEVRGGECMMVRKGMRGDTETEAAQMPEKTLRIAYSGKRMHAAGREVLRADVVSGVEQVVEFASGERHCERRWRRGLDADPG